MKNRMDQLVLQLAPALAELSNEIYKNPELGHEEFLASKLHMELLKSNGFTVESEYKGMKTAFKASYDSGKMGPAIAYLAEYDALPEIGHGCGHNLLGTVSTGAAILLSKVIDKIGGRVVVFGTPAEETNGGKVTLAEQGSFDDIDVALIAHPDIGYTKSGSSLAMEAIQFEFKGKTSHAASAPEAGINALDGVINTFNNINALRQQVRSDARIHGVITKGGEAANVIPDHCIAQFYVRAKTKSYLKELIEKVKNCAKGASLGAGTELIISNYELSYDNLLTNQTLSNTFTNILLNYVDNVKEPRESTGSIDAGNVSHICPVIHPYFSISEDDSIVGHSREFGACTLTEYAYENMLITIKALALTGVRIIEDNELLKEIKNEFHNAIK